MSEIRESAAVQARLARALLDANAYPDAVGIEHVETHISHVFLTGRYAYKIKKPLDLGFLDFSTLERRRWFCEEELRINRRLAPELYLAVVPITGTPDAPQVEGTGKPIEYAVKMRQFAQADVLDRVLEDGRLHPQQVDEIAHQIAAFHAAAATAAHDGSHGSAHSVRAAAEQNFEQLAPLIGDRADDDLERLHRWSRMQGERLDALFTRRKAEGFVRECHGDLHLGNIALVDGNVRAFDALEFSEALRWIDVLSDVAFLAMDLRAHGRADLSARFVDAYLAHSGDYDGTRTLRYYQVYRALVRAKVAALGAQQADLPAGRAAALRGRCEALIALAYAFTTAPQPALILLHGVSGAGKTWGSQYMLEATGAIRVRSDVERKRLHGMQAAARSRSALGTGLYTDADTRDTYARLAQCARAVLRGGFPVLVDATFLHAHQRLAFAEIAQEEKVPFRIASFVADEATLRARVRQRRELGVDASEATLEVLEQQLREREPLTAREAACATTFDTSRMSGEQIRAAAVRLLLEAASNENRACGRTMECT